VKKGQLDRRKKEKMRKEESFDESPCREPLRKSSTFDRQEKFKKKVCRTLKKLF